MSFISISRRIQFAAGHRVFNHESKCANPHGHNYVAFVHAESKTGLDDLGRVIDFSVLKEKIGGWIDANWDHGFIYFERDTELFDLFHDHDRWKSFGLPMNPTAENMARYLLRVVCPIALKDSGVTVWKVQLMETENCVAEATDTDPDLAVQ